LTTDIYFQPKALCCKIWRKKNNHRFWLLATFWWNWQNLNLTEPKKNNRVHTRLPIYTWMIRSFNESRSTLMDHSHAVVWVDFPTTTHKPWSWLTHSDTLWHTRRI
jgi:hypothetical protein